MTSLKENSMTKIYEYIEYESQLWETANAIELSAFELGIPYPRAPFVNMGANELEKSR
ncbi:unnamed protein product [Ceratitis capitata]|uniref:(Mediterranean fruit fly) hypothetical protein n=1 Tax=Ceratitis capitata TaxID=7213 RepID=A0A811UJ80_CERCA|nr:unnamed protein product [Ceratitis capitata]